MTPAQIAALLAETLSVRLALLDADPTGDGRFVDTDGNVSGPMPCAVFKRSPFVRLIDRGAAFLPCNPLAIVEHAARLRFGADFVAALDSQPGAGCCASASYNAHFVKSFEPCPHTAALALLRGVVGG